MRAHVSNLNATFRRKLADVNSKATLKAGMKLVYCLFAVHVAKYSSIAILLHRHCTFRSHLRCVWWPDGSRSLPSCRSPSQLAKALGRFAKHAFAEPAQVIFNVEAERQVREQRHPVLPELFWSLDGYPIGAVTFSNSRRMRLAREVIDFVRFDDLIASEKRRLKRGDRRPIAVPWENPKRSSRKARREQEPSPQKSPA